MTAARWLARHPLLAHLLVTAAVVGLVFGLAFARDRAQDADRARFVECVARWADATSARSDALGAARRTVDGMSDALWRAMADLLAHPRPDAQPVFSGVLAGYVRASDAYRASLAGNPAPAPPRLAC